MRIKRGVLQKKRHKKILKMAKGFRGRRKNVFRLAKQAVIRAGSNRYIGLKLKKRDKRRLWITKINAGLGQFAIKYSRFINLLKKKKIELDRKILADLAENEPDVFKAVVDRVKE